jgi:hypothetical protein
MKIRTRSNLILTLLFVTLLVGCKGEGSQYAGPWQVPNTAGGKMAFEFERDGDQTVMIASFSQGGQTQTETRYVELREDGIYVNIPFLGGAEKIMHINDTGDLVMGFMTLTR